MRILYDTYWWGTGPVSGRVVVREVLQAWREAHPEDEFVLGVRPVDRAEVERAFPGTRTVGILGRPHGVATASQYAWHARRHRVDVTFTQNFSPPGTWSVIFVHDVLFQTNPEWFTAAERAYFKLITVLARGADLVLTSSRHEAARIRAQNPALTRVEAVGLSVAGALLDAVPQRPAVTDGVDGFVLTVGRLNVRKNLGTTLRGALASGRLTRHRPLVVVGSKDGVGEVLPPEVDEAVEAGLVRFVPHVSNAELAWLYAHAELFVYLALDEGYGLPPVEALRFGTPVLVSDRPVFHETLGSHATYVDPLDAGAVAAAVRAVSTERVRAPAVGGSWQDVVRRTRAAILVARAGRRAAP